MTYIIAAILMILFKISYTRTYTCTVY